MKTRLLPIYFQFLCFTYVYSATNQAVLNSLPNTSILNKPGMLEYVEQIRVKHNIQGLTIGVVLSDGETEVAAWGKRKESGEKMTTDTRFTIASCSKAFTASAFAILIDDFVQGRNKTRLPRGVTKLTWDTKVKDLLPDKWDLVDKWATEKASMRDILSHMSGLPRHDFSVDRSDTPIDVISNIKYLKPTVEFRQKWQYNNLMYMITSEIITLYAKTDFVNFISDRVFKPLKMSASTYSPSQAEASGNFTQSWTKDGRRIPAWFTDADVKLSAGAGGIITTAPDLMKWLSLWALDKYEGPLPRSVMQETNDANAIARGDTRRAGWSITGYGMGWQRSSFVGVDIVTHSGAIPGVTSFVAFSPTEKFGFTILTNTDERVEALYAITEEIVRRVLRIATPHLASSLLPVQESTPTMVDHSMPHAGRHAQELVEKYTGSYSSKGYGSFKLCSAQGTSKYCIATLSNYTAVDRAKGIPRAEGALFATWPRIWSSHLRLQQTAQPQRFSIDLTYLFPVGYGRNKTAFEISETGSAKGIVDFVIDNSGRVIGFGLFGLNGVPAPETVGVSVQESGEVWFDKVDF